MKQQFKVTLYKIRLNSRFADTIKNNYVFVWLSKVTKQVYALFCWTMTSINNAKVFMPIFLAKWQLKLCADLVLACLLVRRVSRLNHRRPWGVIIIRNRLWALSLSNPMMHNSIQILKKTQIHVAAMSRIYHAININISLSVKFTQNFSLN